jgi:hypothetical protein
MQAGLGHLVEATASPEASAGHRRFGQRGAHGQHPADENGARVQAACAVVLLAAVLAKVVHGGHEVCSLTLKHVAII